MVTGAGGGIGKAIVHRLSGEGVRVIATDLRIGPDTFGDADVVPVAADICDPQQIEKVLGALEGAPLDYLVNAAGIALFDEDGSTFEIDDRVWERVLAVNLHGLRSMTKAALPALRRGDGRSIVHIASVAGLRGMDAPLDAYQVSKAAVVSFSQAIALQLGPEGIRSNTVCPGAILTPMIEPIYQADPQRRQAMVDRTPIRRLGTPEDVAGAVSFLLSPDAGFITATDLVVDGGWSNQLK